VPLVIFAHELGNTHTAGIPYAEELVTHGIAVYTFDFRGGSVSSKSSGQTTEMSVMTEADDIKQLIDAAKTCDFVDTEKIVLIGASQGGAASSVYASANGNEIAGLILLYPAFVIKDDLHEQFDSLDEIPGDV
jgi:alpha-beta hydrolase superfamily lysophospholipase